MTVFLYAIASHDFSTQQYLIETHWKHYCIVRSFTVQEEIFTFISNIFAGSLKGSSPNALLTVQFTELLSTVYIICIINRNRVRVDQNRSVENLPQIFKGASSSSRIGWLRNSSLDFKHSPRISFSVSCTFFPGRDPRTEIEIYLADIGKYLAKTLQ